MKRWGGGGGGGTRKKKPATLFTQTYRLETPPAKMELKRLPTSTTESLYTLALYNLMETVSPGHPPHSTAWAPPVG